MKFFLIRHGQSEASIKKIEAGHSDIPLTKLGKEQADALGEDLMESGIKFDAVYSSDIVRASETTTIICDKLGIKEVIFDKRLREHDAGIFTGRKLSSITKEEKEFMENTLVDLNLRVPGGETNREMTLRIEEAFHEIVTNNPEDSTILLIGHGGTLYHILVRILKLLPSKMEEWFGNCAKNILERKSKDDAWSITMFNNKQLKD